MNIFPGVAQLLLHSVNAHNAITAAVNIVQPVNRAIWCSVTVVGGPKIHRKCVNKWPITETFGAAFRSLGFDGQFDDCTVKAEISSKDLANNSTDDGIELDAPISVMEMFDAKYIHSR